eukprot:2412270-Pyramimonas_sp.AAC.1
MWDIEYQVAALQDAVEKKNAELALIATDNTSEHLAELEEAFAKCNKKIEEQQKKIEELQEEHQAGWSFNEDWEETVQQKARALVDGVRVTIMSRPRARSSVKGRDYVTPAGAVERQGLQISHARGRGRALRVTIISCPRVRPSVKGHAFVTPAGAVEP